MLTKLFKKKDTEPVDEVFCRPHAATVYSRYSSEPAGRDAPKITPKTAPVPNEPNETTTPEFAAPQQSAPINMAAHLYSESEITVDLLRRALPLRFRKIDARARWARTGVGYRDEPFFS
tara:strand:- start:1002 stop:1358 length:357 start_codon:yes stop_codon:yes gene_type:complete